MYDGDGNGSPATAQGRYQQLAVRREPFLRRARQFAEWTIPSVCPPEGHDGLQDLPECYQSFGARCVLNLASQLLLALLPPDTNFFRFTVPNETVLKSGNMSISAEVEKGLALAEDLCQSEIERASWRDPTNTSLQHLIITGNVLEQILPDNRIKLFRLDQYVVVRDSAGTVLEIVVQECLSPLTLPEAARNLVDTKDRMNPDHKVDLYTWVKRLPSGDYTFHQEINDQIVPGSKSPKVKKSPFIPLRWSALPGQPYGRGRVEEFSGDFRSLEGTWKSLVDGAAMAARNVTLVSPNGTGNLKRKVAEARNGAVLSGNPADVAMLRFENVPGLDFAVQVMDRIAQNLAAGFMLTTGFTRDAERVTAEEIRMVIRELEKTLGGTYSLLAQEMQRPRLQRLVLQMQRQRRLPPWDDSMVEPTITTGVEALGREAEASKVQMAIQAIVGLPEQALDYVPWEDLLKTLFIGVGLAARVKSDREVMQMRQARSQAQMGEKIAPVAAKAALDNTNA